MDIRFSLTDKELLAALDRLTRCGSPSGMRGVLKEIGEDLAESTTRRFESSTAPDGSRWAGLSQGTILARLAKASGVTSKKTGKLGKKGATLAMNAKPLIDTGELSRGIRYQLMTGGAGVEIGTNRTFGKGVGSEVHQFGTRNGKNPARPFLGISDKDRTGILDTVARYLSENML